MLEGLSRLGKITKDSVQRYSGEVPDAFVQDLLQKARVAKTGKELALITNTVHRASFAVHQVVEQVLGVIEDIPGLSEEAKAYMIQDLSLLQERLMDGASQKAQTYELIRMLHQGFKRK